jgi:hypothetical protein
LNLSSEKTGFKFGFLERINLVYRYNEENRLVTSVATAPSELIGIHKHLFLQLVGSNAELEAKMRLR